MRCLNDDIAAAPATMPSVQVQPRPGLSSPSPHRRCFPELTHNFLNGASLLNLPASRHHRRATLHLSASDRASEGAFRSLRSSFLLTTRQRLSLSAAHPWSSPYHAHSRPHALTADSQSQYLSNCHHGGRRARIPRCAEGVRHFKQRHSHGRGRVRPRHHL